MSAVPWVIAIAFLAVVSFLLRRYSRTMPLVRLPPDPQAVDGDVIVKFRRWQEELDAWRQAEADKVVTDEMERQLAEADDA